jgi:hypothetical protein
MRAITRVVCLLLCLLLVAKGGVAAMLSTTGASGYAHPIADACPLGGLASFAGEHGGGQEQPSLQSPSDDPSGGAHRLHHHHACLLLCSTPAAVPTPMFAASSPADSAPVHTSAAYSSQLLAPPLHPPRVAG